MNCSEADCYLTAREGDARGHCGYHIWARGMWPERYGLRYMGDKCTECGRRGHLDAGGICSACRDVATQEVNRCRQQAE